MSSSELSVVRRSEKAIPRSSSLRSKAAIPAELAGLPLELADDGHALVYTFDVQADQGGIAALLRQLGELGIDFKDLRTRESSLEDIFVSLVRGSAPGSRP